MNHNFSADDLIGRDARTSVPANRLKLPILALREFSIPLPLSPLHPRLIDLGAAFLIAAFVTDVAYAKSLLFQWENFSIWLITAGLLVAALAGLTLVLDIVLHRVTRIDWLRFSGFCAAALLSVLNALVHSRDAYTAVVPQGLALSALVCAILVVFGWRGWSVGAPQSARPINTEETRS